MRQAAIRRALGSFNPRRRGLMLGLTALLLATLAPHPGLASSAQPGACQITDPDLLTWVVPLNSTGIGDLKFVNPRVPLDWLKKVERAGLRPSDSTAEAAMYKNCLSELRLKFRNEASGRSFLISFPFKLKTEAQMKKELAAALEELQQTLLAARGGRGARAGAALSAALDDLQRLLDAIEVVDGQGKTRKELVGELEAALETFHQALLVRGRAGCDSSLVEELEKALWRAREAVKESEGTRRQAQHLIDEVYALLDPSPNGKPCSFECETCRAEVLAREATSSSSPLARRQAERLLKSVNGMKQAQRTRELLSDLAEQCGKPDAGGMQTCSLQIGVPAGSTQEVNRQEWAAVASSASNVIKFSATFFDEEGTPSNPTGYLRVGKVHAEEPSKITWSLSAGVGTTRDPLAGRTDEGGEPRPFTADDPYVGDQRRRFPGSGRLSLKQTYNNLAVANVDLTFKAGDLGEADTTRDLTASKYDVTVYGTRGFAIRAGKYTLAAPSDGLAIRESGEAFEIVGSRFNNISLGHLVKRESIEGTANDANLDSAVTILHGRNLALRGSDFFTSADFTVLYGEENKKDQSPYDYTTLGGEVRFARAKGLDKDLEAFREKLARERGAESASGEGRDDAICERPCVTDCPSKAKPAKPKSSTSYRWPFSGSLAVYSSDRSTKNRPVVLTPTVPPAEPTELTEVSEGSGTVGLVTLKWTRMKIIGAGAADAAEFFKTKAERSFRLRLGRGSGDDPSSTEKDEGYLGETAAFAPDKLFLASLAKNLDSGGMGQIGAGLSNKTYGEFTYTDHTWSIFRRLALVLTDIEPDEIKNKTKKDPIVTQATIFRVHVYRFNEPVLGSRDAGFEIGLDFQVQVPKGVKATLGLGKFFPGGALEPLFASDPYVISLTTSVTLQ